MSGRRKLSVEEELALRLVATRACRERDREAIRLLAARSDLRRLRALIAFYRMDSLLGKRLIEAAGSLPDWLTSELQEAETQERYRGLAQELATIGLAGLLEREGIPCLPLKGQTLSRAVHGDVGLRASTDFDLLVDADRLDSACRVLRGHGYGLPVDSVFEDGLPLLHYQLLATDHALPPVELHWRVHWFESEFSKRMLERSRKDPECGRRAEPADELASLLLFYARDGFTGLRLLADLSAWWDTCGHDLPDGGLERLVGAHPQLSPVLRAAAAVSERLVGVPASRLFKQPRPATRREDRATRLADLASSNDPDQVAVDRSLVDALLSPPEGGRIFVRRQLMGRPGRRGVVHLSKLLARSALALWQLRGGRSLTPVEAKLGDGLAPAAGARIPR